MAIELDLTGAIQRIDATAGTTQKQPLQFALDVSSIDVADLLLTITAKEGAATSFVVSVWTSMTNTSEGSWISLGSYTSTVTMGPAEKKTFVGMLKYIRWSATIDAGAVSFTLQGMGRTS